MLKGTDDVPEIPAPDSVADKLLIEEYKSCRDLIAKNIDIIERTEVYAVGAAAAAATFCLASPDQVVVRITCWIPLVILLLGLLRFIGIDSTIDKINNYLTCVERKYPILGWTQSYRCQNKSKILKVTRYLVWLVPAAASLGFALYFFFHGPIAAKAAPAPTGQAHAAKS